MISPAYSLTAPERALPKLAIDFTTASLDSRITFTRTGNTATVTNSSGTIVGINANLPRFDYDPVTLKCTGLLIEEARTNVLLNSLIKGTILSTQAVTTTATAYTLSFYGSGTVTLSGTHSATVVGTGAYPSRKTYTFTPTAGALTVTVTGTVQFAQLETGAFATSFIPTTATSSTRNVDVATMTGTNFSNWFNISEGTFFIEGSRFAQGTFAPFFSANNGTLEIYATQVSNAARAFVNADGAITCNGTWNTNAINSMAFAYKANDMAGSFEGTTVVTDATVTMFTADRLRFGNRAAGTNQLSGYLVKMLYWPSRLTNAEIQAFSK